VSSSAGSWTLSGRYRVGERLGAGGTADVFRAHDDVLDRDVAIKVFRTPLGNDELDSTARRDVELQSLARLNHPNLIRLLDGSVSPDEPTYLVLDLVCGPDLATRLHDGPLPEDDVRAIGGQIAGALDYAHGMGMVHRDVKPANILLGEDGPDGGVWARLSDFGTVRMVDGARLTAADLTLGTASYIAPEQARGSDVGPAADVYSLGLVLIEALTGRRCFPETTPEALAARLTSTPVVPDAAPADLRALLTSMTALEPDQRPSAATVAECLVAAAVPEAVSAADLAAVPEPIVAADAEDSTVRTPPAAPLEPAVAGVPPIAADSAMAVAVADEPRRTRHRSGVLFALAGLAFAAMLAGAAFLLMGGAASSGSQTPLGPNRPAPSADSTHHVRTTQAGVEEVRQSGSVPRTRASTHARQSLQNAARTTATRTAPAGQGGITTTSSAPASSPTVSSSAPVSSTSAAPSTSPPPSTSSPASQPPPTP
jgi:eukaryotic-like serine/threonine-protein kinase